MTEPIGFIRHIEHCTHHNLSLFVPFVVAEKEVGYVKRDVALLVAEESGFQMIGNHLVLAPITETVEARTAALRRASDLLSAHYDIPLQGEIYPIIKKWGEVPLAHIDRAAIPWFGVKGNGVHVNGYVRKGKDIHIWVGQRAKSRKIDPDKLDNMVGGGLPLGYSVEENLAKEAWEEAGLTAEQVAPAQSIHSLSYKVEMMKGLRNDTLFVFDLELPEDVIPKNTDGEVDHFELIPAKAIMKIIHDTNRFKFNCNVIMIDFLIRHGILTSDQEEYMALDEALSEIRD